jgi:hypothetical protein
MSPGTPVARRLNFEPPQVRRDEDEFSRRALDRLLAQLYGIPQPEPENLNGFTRMTLPQLAELMQAEQIVRFEIPPLMQPFAGPPGTLNRIITYYTLDGQKLFVKARYDPVSNRIDPPV